MTYNDLCLYMLWHWCSVFLFSFFMDQTCMPLIQIFMNEWFRQGRQLSMRIQWASGFFCILVLLANSVWSWEVNNFHWVKSDNGELLCGMSPPNETLKDIGSRAQCMSACFKVCPSPCQAVNYWTNARFCQHFYYIPCSYAAQEDCVNYQVATILSKCIEFTMS